MSGRAPRTDPRRRVLLLTPDFPPRSGGIQLLMQRLAEELSSYRVRVVTLSGPGAREFDQGSSLDVQRSRALARVGRARIAALSVRALAESLRFGPQIVVVGHVVAVLGAAAIRRQSGVPFVLYLHADEFRVWPRFTSRAARAADAVIAVSRHTRDMALSAGVRPERVHLVLNGVDRPTGSPTPGEREPIVVTVSRLTERYKGHDVMLRAMPLIRAKVPNARWVVVGDGSLKDSLRSRALTLGLEDAVHFTGPVTDAERDRWLARAQLFALPSRLHPGGVGGEGFGIVYLEAAVRGVPVLAGDRGGALDAVDPGGGALLVDPEDHIALVEAISSALAEPAEARRMGEAGRSFASELTWRRTSDGVAAVIESVLAGRA